MGWVLLSNVFCEAISLLSQLARRCDDVWILLADGVVTLRVTDWRLICAGCLAGSALAADAAAPPDFSPNASVGWVSIRGGQQVLVGSVE